MRMRTCSSMAMVTMRALSMQAATGNPTPLTPPSPREARCKVQPRAVVGKLPATGRHALARAGTHRTRMMARCSSDPTSRIWGHDETALPSVEGAGDDAARALRLKQEQDAVIQATMAAKANFGDEASMHIVGQLNARKVEALKERTKATGVAPAMGGRELIQLTPEELNVWIEGTLKPAEGKEDEATKEL